MKEVPWRIYRRRLPHWRVDGATSFVTWRFLTSQGELIPAERSCVRDALLHFHRKRYTLVAYVVMNDHVHVVVTPLDGRPLETLVHSWKSFTAYRLQREFGRIGSVWLDECFDRIVRDEAELENTVNYVLGNPWKRWPNLEEYEWVGMPDAGGE